MDKQVKTELAEHRQSCGDSGIIGSDTKYQLDLDELRRHYIALLREIMRAKGERVITIRLN